MADDNASAGLIWSLAGLVGAVAVALLGFAAATTAVAFAVPVLIHGTLAGVALAPQVTTFAAAGLGAAGVGGGATVVGVLLVRAVKLADEKPFQVAVPLLAVANAMFMAVAYELLPDKNGGVIAKIMVSGLSPAGLIIGAVMFDKPGLWSKIAGGVLHLLLQVAAIAWILISCLLNPLVREETLPKLAASPLSMGLGALAAITIIPAFIFLTWNDQRKAH